MCWDAISAIGQCAGAIATVAAVVVALKPYRKEASIEVETITIKFNGESQTIPMTLTVRNIGGMGICVDSYGITCTKQQLLHRLATNVSQCVQPNCAISFRIDANKTSEIINEIQHKRIIFWVEDQSGTIYFSQKYDKQKINASTLDDYFG